MLEADVTRPITIVSPDGTKQTIVQTVHLTRTATVDEETGDVIYGNWTTGQFKAYPVSDVDGYTTEVKYGDSAEAKRVDGDVKASDITITGQDADAKPENGEPVIVTYKLNDASGKISYQTSDGTEVGSQTISGKAGQTSTYKTTVPTGYELTDPNQTAVTVTYPTDGSQKTVVVTVQAKNDTYDNTGDKPDWVKEATTKDVTRTIHFAYPDSYTGTKHDDVVQTVHFTRTATKNEATGDVTYGDWTAQGSDQFDAFNAPDIHGYHPTSSALVVTGVKADGSYDDVTITYAPDDLVGRVIYKYTDKNGNVSVVGAQTVNGTTDESRQLTDGDLNVPKGYKLVDGEALPTINFKPGQTNEVTVNVDHVIEHFNSGDDIDSHKGDMPKGVDITAIKQGMTKTVTRTVYVTPVNGERHQVDQQTAHFKRGVTIDFATGAVIYDPSWTSDDATFKDASSEVAPAPTGYSIVSTHTYGQETVTANDNDIDVEVTYAAAKSHITIVAKDKSNNNETITIPSSISTTLDGQTAATVDPKNVQTYVDAISKALESEGYQFDSTDTFPTAFNGDTTLNIYFTHRIDDKTTNLPSGSEDVTKDVTRRIHVIAPDGQDYYIDQTVTATRQAKVDAVTHKVTGYTDWTIPELTSVTAPQYAGYTPSIASVESHTPTADEINAGHTDEVTITYTGLATTQSYEYIDADTGSQVGQTYQGANGKVGDKVNFDTEITTNIPNGYELLPGQTLPGEHELGQTNQTIKVYVRKTVVDDKNKTTTTPKGSDKSTLKDLSKTITRTVIAHVPGKDAQPIASQEVHFTRTATWNDATKSWDYSDWKVDGSQVWDAINDKDIPEVAGYTHTPVHVDSYNVLPSTQNQTVDITYTALDHTTHVIYKYGDLTINTKELTGKTGDTVQTNINDGIPENYELVPDQNLPENITFAADGHADIVVNLEHAQDHYDGKTGEKPAWATEDTTRTVTRTIHLVYPEGKKPEGAEDTHTDSATFTRTATRDKVTGQVTYSAWTLASGDANFKKFTAPEVANYTPSTSEIAAETVTADSPDTNYTITYNANGTNFTIKASDVTGDTPVDIPIPTGINPVITHKSDGSDNDEFSAKKAGVIAEIKQGMAKDVTRSIYETKPGESRKLLTKQTVHFTRTASIDRVTGKVTYGAWTPESGSWDAYPVQGVEGYEQVVTGGTLSETPVTGDMSDQDVEVTYTSQAAQDITVVARDVTDKTNPVDLGQTQSLHGNVDSPVSGKDLSDAIEKIRKALVAKGYNYQGVDGEIPVKFDNSKHTIVLDFTRATDEVPGGTTIPDKYKGIIADSDVTKTYTRTINLHYNVNGHEVVEHVTQPVTLTRTATVDLAKFAADPTDKTAVTYGAWTTADYPEYSIPDKAGYTPYVNDNETHSLAATPATDDVNVDVYYKGHEGTQIFKYIDAASGNQVGVDVKFTGNVGDSEQTYTYAVPAGYKLAKGQGTSSTYSFTDGINTTNIYLDHDVQEVTPTTIPEGSTDVTKADLTKTVTRTISYKYEDGTVAHDADVQTITLTRTAYVDPITHQVTYSNWTSDKSFTDVTAPIIDGYTPSKTEVLGHSVDGDSDNEKHHSYLH
ncbi:mucin-binding protein [Lactobacillus jensenii]|uniref:Mucin-binding protein n=1 Tax=Lactobacillus jensenii TaxID=109790 RepID=A0ABU9FGD3_LACJE|nr:mucin-binding protein [Lactobacillus jensenii]MDT9544071.1 mucin-binding protein [Lactobacillus jensenii]